MFFLKVKGEEFGDWTYVDLAACLGNSYKIGNHWGATNKPVHDLPDSKWGTDDGKKVSRLKKGWSFYE